MSKDRGFGPIRPRPYCIGEAASGLGCTRRDGHPGNHFHYAQLHPGDCTCRPDGVPDREWIEHLWASGHQDNCPQWRYRTPSGDC